MSVTVGQCIREKITDTILFIPRKIYFHFENYKIMEIELQKEKAINNDLKKRLKTCKYYAECNSYNDHDYREKIKEIANIEN